MTGAQNISKCFEPYLQSYSEVEYIKIKTVLDQIIVEDKIEKLDYVIFSSSLHLFKNLKASLKRCVSFSKSKALFDLQVAFKDVIKHYTVLLKQKLPAKAW